MDTHPSLVTGCSLQAPDLLHHSLTASRYDQMCVKGLISSYLNACYALFDSTLHILCLEGQRGSISNLDTRHKSSVWTLTCPHCT